MSDDEFISRLRWGLGVIDVAAKKSDRWWFFALLMIGLLYIGFERWEAYQERTAVRTVLADRDHRIEALHDSIETKFAQTVIENTRALDRNTAILEARAMRSGN